MRYPLFALALVALGLLCVQFSPAAPPEKGSEAISAPSPTTPSPAPAAATQPTSRADAASQPDGVRRAHFFVSGRVQAVGFRAFTFENARKLKVNGWVKNLADGRVEGVAEGPADAVAKLLAAVNVGPSGARVDKLEVRDEKPTGEFRTFTYIH